MDIVFLDANVLFSAAYRPGSALRRLWQLPDVQLLTSSYAAEEARRNLATQEQRDALVPRMEALQIVTFAGSSNHPIFSTIQLPEKDASAG